MQGDTLAPYIFAIVLDYCMIMALKDQDERLGFCLERRRSRRLPPTILTDMNFADDIALISQQIEQAQELLHRVEVEANKVGLHINIPKIKAIIFNITGATEIRSKDRIPVREVDDFKYLGARMQSSEKDVSIRKALAWSGCHKLRKVWTSNLSRNIKVRLFVATGESVLLYVSETWTITKSMKKQLDGCYTRMLRMSPYQ